MTAGKERLDSLWDTVRRPGLALEKVYGADHYQVTEDRPDGEPRPLSNCLELEDMVLWLRGFQEGARWSQRRKAPHPGQPVGETPPTPSRGVGDST